MSSTILGAAPLSRSMAAADEPLPDATSPAWTSLSKTDNDPPPTPWIPRVRELAPARDPPRMRSPSRTTAPVVRSSTPALVVPSAVPAPPWISHACRVAPTPAPLMKTPALLPATPALSAPKTSRRRTGLGAAGAARIATPTAPSPGLGPVALPVPPDTKSSCTVAAPVLLTSIPTLPMAPWPPPPAEMFCVTSAAELPPTRMPTLPYSPLETALLEAPVTTLFDRTGLDSPCTSMP